MVVPDCFLRISTPPPIISTIRMDHINIEMDKNHSVYKCCECTLIYRLLMTVYYYILLWWSSDEIIMVDWPRF